MHVHLSVTVAEDEAPEDGQEGSLSFSSICRVQEAQAEQAQLTEKDTTKRSPCRVVSADHFVGMRRRTG